MQNRGEAVRSQVTQARRGSAAATGNKELQQEIAQYLQQSMGRMREDFAIVKEKAEVLYGERGDKSNAAVRRSDLKPLRQISLPTSERASAAPTQSEFNALVDDVHEINQQLRALSKALSGT